MIYTNEEKQLIIEDYKINGNATYIAKVNMISKSTLYRWLDDFGLRTPIELKMSKSDLRKKINRLNKLEGDNKIYGDVLNLMNLTTKEKFIYAKSLDSVYLVHSICNLLHLSRSTYYNDKFRKVEVTLVEKDDNMFKPIIKRIFQETKGRLCSPKIRRLMMKEGYKIDEKRV